MDFMILQKWFNENHMVLNLGKCHYIVIGDDDSSHKIISNDNEIASSNEEKLLGILLGNKLNFESHITSPCKKAGQKFSDSKSSFMPESIYLYKNLVLLQE